MNDSPIHYATPDREEDSVGLDARAHRRSRLLWSVGTALLTKPLAVVIPLLIVRLFVEYLGQQGAPRERYGLYEAVGGLAIWLGLTNFGLGLGLINKLTDCYVSGDRDLARRYVSSAMAAVGVLSLAGLAIISIAVPLVDWSRVFKVTSDVARAELPWSIWVVGMIGLIGVLFTVPSAVYAAYQELHRANVWDAIQRVLTLAAAVAIVHTRWGVVGAILASAGVPVAARVMNGLWLFLYEKPYLRPHPALFDWSLLKETLVPGFGFFVLSFAVVLIFETDKLIIGTVLGLSEVAGYALLGRLFLTAYGVFMVLLMPMWSAYGEALRRGDVAWVKTHLNLSLLIGCGLILCCGIALFFFQDRILQVLRILRMWPGAEQVTIPKGLVLAMTSLFVLRAWVDCRSVVLNAASVLRPQMILFASHAILNLVLGVWFAKLFGAAGVAWATSVAGLATTAWGYVWITRRYFRQLHPA